MDILHQDASSASKCEAGPRGEPPTRARPGLASVDLKSQWLWVWHASFLKPSNLFFKSGHWPELLPNELCTHRKGRGGPGPRCPWGVLGSGDREWYAPCGVIGTPGAIERSDQQLAIDRDRPSVGDLIIFVASQLTNAR